MKANHSTFLSSSNFVTLLLILFSTVAFSQVTEKADTMKVVKSDTLKTTQADTLKAGQVAPLVAPVEVPAVIPVAEPAVTPAVTPAVAPKEKPAETPATKPAEAPAETKKADEEKPVDKKDKKGKKNEIIFYGGVNFTKLASSSGNYESESDLGYQLGGYYKQGRLLYWQAGARFANTKVGYKLANSPESTGFSGINISEVDFPITGGINFTSFMNRVLSVRLFVSAVPSFTLKVGDNDFGFTKEDVNSFILYGQGGLGINVAFLVLELGYNYGFNEVLVDNTDSKPGQVFINLGFRF